MLLSSRDLAAEATCRPSLEDWPDADLLALFLQRRGARSEDAFAELVERHGPLVLRACRSIVHDEHEAQDAFQATFLVLARKAQGLWVRDSLAPWLHGVACRMASDVRKSAGRRRTFERRMAGMGNPSAVVEEPGEVDELAAVIQEEIGRLPELHRSAVILCDMQGRTHQEAAHLLRCPVGTIKSRQSRRGRSSASGWPAGASRSRRSCSGCSCRTGGRRLAWHRSSSGRRRVPRPASSRASPAVRPGSRTSRRTSWLARNRPAPRSPARARVAFPMAGCSSRPRR